MARGEFSMLQRGIRQTKRRLIFTLSAGMLIYFFRGGEP